MTIEIWLKSFPAKTEYYKGGNVLRVEDPPPMWIYIFSCVSLRLIFIMSMSPPHHPLGGGEVDLCPGIFDGASFIPRVSPRVIHNSAQHPIFFFFFFFLLCVCLVVKCRLMLGSTWRPGGSSTQISTGDDDEWRKKTADGTDTHACDTRRAAKEEERRRNKGNSFLQQQQQHHVRARWALEAGLSLALRMMMAAAFLSVLLLYSPATQRNNYRVQPDPTRK